MTAVLRLIRPKQWSKNILVFAAILFAQQTSNLQNWIISILTFISFSLVASGVYVINDLLDVEVDRLHPKKKFRPIASGEIKPQTAIILAILLFVLGLFISYTINLLTFIILSGYMVIMIAYSVRLKHILLVDVFIIALGLTSRAVIGGIAIEVSISTWLQVCTFFIALMLALIKRRQELARLGKKLDQGRKSLREAPPTRVFDLWIMMVSAITILAYSLYATDSSTVERIGSNGLLYSIPFVVFAILRYHIAVYSHGKGEDPTETLFSDRLLIYAIIGWLIVALISIL